jgi:hypothetical protein
MKKNVGFHFCVYFDFGLMGKRRPSRQAGPTGEGREIFDTSAKAPQRKIFLKWS